MRIYVGNIPYSMTEQELRDLFTPFGAIQDATIISDRASGESKGFGFVEMPERREAQAAINDLNGQSINGRSIVVNEARPRTDRGDRGGGGGGGRGGHGGGHRFRDGGQF